MMFALLFFVWMLFSSVSCQRFGNITENSITCTQVNLSVNVDPQSSTFAFNWFTRVNDNTANINLALVGLNGGGTVGVILQNNTYSGQYNISNNPVVLATNTSPWDTSISFSLTAENTCFRFLVSTVTLEAISPREYCRPISCQTFGTMRLDSRNCSHVTLTVNVNPLSSTFAFNWFLRVNGSTTNINLALVGLNGNGTVGVALQNNAYSGQYMISNNPSTLATSISAWNTSITFTLPAEATSFRFLVSTGTLEEISPDEYSRPNCNLGVDRNCVDPGNNETCPSIVYCGTSYNRICTDGSEFTSSYPDVNANFSSNMLKQCLQPDCCINGNSLTRNELACICTLSVIGGIGFIIGQLLVIFTKPSSPKN